MRAVHVFVFALGVVLGTASCWNFNALDGSGGNGNPTCSNVFGTCKTSLDCCGALMCVGGLCSTQTVTASCTDKKLDGTETGVDCGGSCPACANGNHCKVNKDCQSLTCTNLLCVAATTGTCTDGTRDGNETDVDCGGGTCPACADGRMCVQVTDCQNQDCTDGVCGTTNNTCSDGVKDGSETDVDCGGGTCLPCPDGRHCLQISDCQNQDCSNGTCGAQNTCNDGVQDGNETDVDCGGGTCPRCPNGDDCNSGSDCTSGNCVTNVCQAAAAAYGCNDSLNCIENCTTQACETSCENMINSPNGVNYLNAFFTCLDTACPTTNGGACDPTSPNYNTTCGPCTDNALSGNCATSYNNCMSD